MEYGNIISSPSVAIAIAIAVADIAGILVPWQLYSRPKHWQISHHRPKSHQRKPETHCDLSLLKNMFLFVERASYGIIADWENCRFPLILLLLLMVFDRPNSLRLLSPLSVILQLRVCTAVPFTGVCKLYNLLSRRVGWRFGRTMALGSARCIPVLARWELADFQMAVNGTVLLLLRTRRQLHPPSYKPSSRHTIPSTSPV